MSTIQPIAAGVSEAQPLPGQDNRSGPNFQFVELPSGGGAITVSTATGIICTLMQDVSGGSDPRITQLTNGTSFSSPNLKTSNNYYLASPSGANGVNFAVTFSGAV